MLIDLGEIFAGRCSVERSLLNFLGINDAKIKAEANLVGIVAATTMNQIAIEYRHLSLRHDHPTDVGEIHTRHDTKRRIAQPDLVSGQKNLTTVESGQLWTVSISPSAIFWLLGAKKMQFCAVTLRIGVQTFRS